MPERNGAMKQMRKIWKLWICAAVLMILSVYFFLFFQRGIRLYDAFLPVHRTEREDVYQGKINGSSVQIEVQRIDKHQCEIAFIYGDTSKNYTVQFAQDADSYLQELVIYEDGREWFQGKYNADSGHMPFCIYDRNGKPYLEDMVTVYIGGQEPEIQGLTVYQLERLWSGDDEIRGDPPGLVIAAVFLIIWAIDVRFPKFFFFMRYRMAVKEEPEPSEFYLTMQRIWRWVCPAAAMVCLIWSLVEKTG